MVSLSPALRRAYARRLALSCLLIRVNPKFGQLPSIVSRQAATDASTGSWAAALAAARHTWAELRCRLQLSEPFMNQHTHLLAAVVVAAADASPCGPQLALHASVCMSCPCCDSHRPACASHRRPVRLLPLLCAACGCALRSRRGSRLLSDWIRGIRAGFGAQCLQLTGH